MAKHFMSLLSQSGLLVWASLAGFILVGSLGCGTVPVSEQRLLAKPGMTFSDSYVWKYRSGIVARVEPGSAFSGGSAAAGCASCK